MFYGRQVKFMSKNNYTESLVKMQHYEKCNALQVPNEPVNVHIMVDPIKELLEIDVHHDTIVVLYVLLCCEHRVRRPTTDLGVRGCVH
jgi:hypothetical protein